MIFLRKNQHLKDTIPHFLRKMLPQLNFERYYTFKTKDIMDILRKRKTKGFS